jgi:hypothetical protein
MPCLLDILDRVREAVEFGIHRGAVMAFAIAQLCCGDCLVEVPGLPTDAMSANLELLTSGLDVAANSVLRVVSVEEIICDLL